MTDDAERAALLIEILKSPTAPKTLRSLGSTIVDEFAAAAFRQIAFRASAALDELASAIEIAASPIPNADGWMPWWGSKRPVAADVWVEVRTSSGDRHVIKAGARSWAPKNGGKDIVAYRMVPPVGPAPAPL